MNNTKSTLFILRSTPYQGHRALEGIEAVLAASVFEQPLGVLFIGDGVWQLKKQQQAEQIERRNLAALLSSFPLYDIESVYVDESSLEGKHLHSNDLLLPVSTLSAAGMAELVANHDTVLTF